LNRECVRPLQLFSSAGDISEKPVMKQRLFGLT